MSTHLSFRQIAVLALLPSFIDSVGAGAVLPIIALQARELGGSVGQAALVVSVMGLGQLIASLPSGAVIARVGERKALLAAGVGQAVAYVAAWLTESLWLYAIAFALLGMSFSVWSMARQGFLIDATPPEYRARVMSSMGGTFRIGLLIGPFIGSALIYYFSLASVFVFAASAALIAVLFVWRTPDLSEAARETAANNGHLSMWQVLRQQVGTLATVGSSVAVIGAARSARFIVVPLWCDAVGLDAHNTSLIFGIAGAVDLSLTYLGGSLMDRYGRVLAGVAVVSGTAAALLLLPLTHTFSQILGVNLLLALTNGLSAGVFLTLGADTAPEVGRAQYLGWWRLTGDLGNSSAPAAVAALSSGLTLAATSVALGGIFAVGTIWVGYWVSRQDIRRGLGNPTG